MTAFTIKDKTAIIGMGHTRWSTSIGKSETAVALEAISKAIDDAGLKPKDIDALTRFDMEQQTEEVLMNNLGLGPLTFFSTIPFGGGAGAGTVLHAAMAVATGQAKYAVAYRARNRGKRSTASAPGKFGGGRPWEKTPMLLTDNQQYHVPFGLVTPAQQVAILTRRHMYEFGTKAEHLGAIAIAQRKNAARNPLAVMRDVYTMEDYLNARMIADPIRLFDCCLETDGGAAVVITSAERAKDAPHRPAYILAASQGLAPMSTSMTNYYKDDLWNTDAVIAAKKLYEMADVGPDDIDVAQLYDAFTPTVLLLIEAYGFAKRGEGGPFAASGAIEWPNGKIPVNTSGGGISEAYVHGYNLVIEAVRQIRGTSTCQVKDAELSLNASAPPVGSGGFILRR